MLRLFLGLFLVMTVGLVLGLQTVDRAFNALLDGQMQSYNREAVRGQAWSLAEQLRGLDGAARERQLDAVRPYYGLGLSLVETDQLSLSDQEKAELAQGLLVIREKYTQFISRIDDGSQLLSIMLPAEPSLMSFYIAAAYLMIAVIFRDAAPPEHHKLLECALRRDAKAAQAILTTHIMDCVAYTLTNTPANLLGLHRLSGKRQSPELAAAPS